DLKRELKNLALDDKDNINEHAVLQCQIKHARFSRITTIISFTQNIIGTVANVATAGASVPLTIALSVGNSMASHIRSKQCDDLKKRLEKESAESELLFQALENPDEE
ncbi:unnamed protein product, partial [Symbiodinium pilosum]